MLKPILFNTDMVRAILDGRKTQTRRLIKPQPEARLCYHFAASGGAQGKWGYPSWNAEETWGKEYAIPDGLTAPDQLWTPPCHADDTLWVRETWCNLLVSPGNHARPTRGRYYYKADDPDIRPDGWRGNWRPSIHMPKEAARLFLRVTDIRAERLHDMTDRDAEKEGIGNLYLEDVGFGDKDYGCISYVDSKGYIGFQVEQFAHLWDSTIKKDKLHRYGWEANPWVWVIEFEQTERPEFIEYKRMEETRE